MGYDLTPVVEAAIRLAGSDDIFSERQFRKAAAKHFKLSRPPQGPRWAAEVLGSTSGVEHVRGQTWRRRSRQPARGERYASRRTSEVYEVVGGGDSDLGVRQVILAMAGTAGKVRLRVNLRDLDAGFASESGETCVESCIHEKRSPQSGAA